MRVLHIGKFFAPYKGGIENHVQLLSSRLSQQISVEVAAFSHVGKNEIRMAGTVPVTLVKTNGQIARAPLSLDLLKLMRNRANDFDLIHVHHPNPMANLAVLLSGYAGRIVVTYHGDIVKSPALQKLATPLFDAMWRRTSAILVNSGHYLNHSPALSHHRDRGHVVPLGIDLDSLRIPDFEAIRSIRARFGERFLLGVGRLVEFKGFSYLLKAMQTVNAKLLLLGDGPIRSRLEWEAKALGVSEKVCFVGNVDVPAPYFHACDMLVFPSCTHAESFGLVQVEAMACGKPVINTDVPSGVPYVSLHGETGLTVPPKNADELASAINLLLGNQELRERFGVAASKRAYSEFSADTMVRRTLDLYGTVLRQPSIAQLRKHNAAQLRFDQLPAAWSRYARDRIQTHALDETNTVFPDYYRRNSI